jgi:2,3-bisphosphoglycerate-dependent phosphoglycerate mutase
VTSYLHQKYGDEIMGTLVLLRHGQSQWNLENRFTGFHDVELSDLGRQEAAQAGDLIRQAGIRFDSVFTSTLKRAATTAEIALGSANQAELIAVMVRHDDLRERDYGDLTGLDKDETKAKYGEEQVHIWRRSYDVQPPGGESLKDVVENRVRPYYNIAIKPLIERGANVLVAAHGNSLRALLIILGENTPENINQTEIPTGSPLVIEFDDNGNRTDKYYLSEKFKPESFIDKTFPNVDPDIRAKLNDLGDKAEVAFDKIKATVNDNERNERIAAEAKELASKAGEATRQGIIKGADAVKRAAEDPAATKAQLKGAVVSTWDKIKGLFGSKKVG